MFCIPKSTTSQFNPVVAHARGTHERVGSSGFAVMVIHNDRIVTEQYSGFHGHHPGAQPIEAQSQFHVASVRKSYIGFAVAYAVHHRFISSIDDPVHNYLPFLDAHVLTGTTIRHLLTHTTAFVASTGPWYVNFSPGRTGRTVTSALKY